MMLSGDAAGLGTGRYSTGEFDGGTSGFDVRDDRMGTSMRRSFTIVSLMLCATLSACSSHEEGSPVQKDMYVRFTSRLGNSFVAPSQWTVEDEGDTYSLSSPDGHAFIYATTFTAEGSGSMDKFRETMTTGLLPKEASGWKDSAWTSIELGDVKASKRALIPFPDANTEWRLYVVDGGRYYHAIVLKASTAAMSVNGEFYESVVCTFEGVRE